MTFIIFFVAFIDVGLADDTEPSPLLSPGSEVRPPSILRRMWSAAVSNLQRPRRNRVHPPNDHQYFGIGDRQDENVTHAN